MLISTFETFYLMLLETKQQIESGAFFDIGDEKNVQNSKIDVFQNKLCKFIKDQDSKIAYEQGKLASIQFQEVLYVMVALADELFLEMDWEGKSFWRANLLEQKFFNSNQSGEKLLLNLDKFLREQNAQDNDIGVIYLYAFSLGFKGKLRYEKDLDFYLQALKNNIFYTIYRQSPKLFKEEGPLFVQSSENMLVEKQPAKDQSMKVWLKIGLACFGMYLLIGQIIWHVETYNIWSVLDKVTEKRV